MMGLSMTAYGGATLDGFEDWLGRAVELGFDFVELVSEWPHFLTHETIGVFKEATGSFNLPVTVHAPFSDVNIASFNDRIREASLEIIRETLELSAELDAMVVTIHPGHCSPVSIRNRGRYLGIHREALWRIARWGEEYGIKMGVENMPSFPILDARTPERLAEIIDGIEIGVTFDVGHLNTTTREFDGFLRLLGDRIVHVHLHDNSGKADEHLPPGKGTVPWEEVFPKLPPVTMALEVESLSDALSGVLFLRKIHR